MYLQEENGDMLLRPMIEGDLEFMLDIRNDVRDVIHDDRIFTLDECIEWYHETRPENYVVTVGGHDVGIMRVRRYKHHGHSAEVGGDIHGDFRRKGFAIRAYNLLIPYLFHTPQIDELFLEVLEINMPAFNLYRKLGFEIHEYKPEMAKRLQGWLDGFVMNLPEIKWETL